jgi:hypothetical protein
MLTPARSASQWAQPEEVQCIIYYDEWEVGGPTAFLPGLRHTGTVAVHIIIMLCGYKCIALSLRDRLHSEMCAHNLQVRAKGASFPKMTAKRCMLTSAARSTTKEQC